MKSAPILIIDKIGLVGEPLFLKLSKEFPVVFVSKNPSANIPFSKKFPVIPDNKYSHVIFISEEKGDLELLPKITDKVKDVNADFIFAQGLFSKGEHAMNKVLRLCPSAKVVIFGEIFENNKFLYQAQKFQKIQIVGSGLAKTYPVFIQDVADGLIDIIFGINNSHSLFYLFPDHPVTELSLAHMIQKANPEVGIDFVKNGSERENISYPPNGKNLLDDKYPIAKKIRNIDFKKTIKTESHKNSKKNHIKRFPIFIVWVLIFLILSPFVFTLIFSFLGLNTLYFAETQMDKSSTFFSRSINSQGLLRSFEKVLDKGNLSNVKASLHLSNAFFYIGKKASDILYFQGKIVGLKDNLKRLLEDIDLGQRISEGLLQAFSSEVYFSKVLTGKTKSPTDDFAKGLNILKSSIIVFEKIKAEDKIPDAFSQKLKIINPFIKLLSSSSDSLPVIFGMEDPRTYLILFQNNLELRPGGGLIGSYGILKLNMGKITHFSIHDTEDADKQLRGHVEPPFALRRYLPTNHWYMKDSNFDVDFVKSASASSNFLFAETGQKVSGVIGIDNTFIKNILDAIGLAYEADYKKTIDEDFLRSLYKTITLKLTEKKAPYLLIAQAISDALTQKHLLFAFSNDFQKTFTVNGWSSSLWDKRKNDEKSVNDFLGINEANLGRNQTNYFISRNIKHKITIEANGRVLEELNISYKNTSVFGQGEDYKNYLRIILPIGTEISEISIQDIPQVLVDAVTDSLIYEAKKFIAPKGLEVEKTNEENKTIYGFIVNIPVGEIVKVKLKYALAGSISGLNSFSYNLKLFKQPGIDSLPYSFSLEFPNNFNAIDVSEGVSKEDGKISFFKKIANDENLIVDFAKK